MGIYEQLGARRIINAAATLTRLGGSRMPRVVIEAMNEAAEGFVDVIDLQKRVGARIAELTHNEAAYVSSGAAAGLTLTTAACVAGTDPAKIARLPRDLDGLKNEVVVHRCQRNGYDFAIRQAGVKLIEIGSADTTTAWELEAALNERTAAVFYFAGAHFERGALSLPRVIEIAHARGVPVIVDAAAQLPPPTNLWHFTRELGADAAVFSGGKGLCGPQSSGLVLGKQWIVDGAAASGSPNAAIGRPMKVGKEEMIGALAALEWYLSLDHDALLASYERAVERIGAAVSAIPGVTARRDFPSEAGQPHPRALVVVDAATLGSTRDEVVARLRDGDPVIEVTTRGGDAILLNPQTLSPDEVDLVAERLRAACGAASVVHA